MEEKPKPIEMFSVGVQLEKESQRTKRILLMVPLDVIESVPTIKNFLLHGRKVEDKELLEAVKSSEKRMQHILDEAFVGHFQFDAKLKITDFNSEVLIPSSHGEPLLP